MKNLITVILLIIISLLNTTGTADDKEPISDHELQVEEAMIMGTDEDAAEPAEAEEETVSDFEENAEETEVLPEDESGLSAEADPVAEDNPFVYEHDPRDNPEAMKDIIEDPAAVYGFSPDPDSKRLGAYAAFDWSDPALVAKAQQERRAYHESMDSMTDILYRMREEGASLEEMARAVSNERNRLRLAACEDDPEALAAAKKSNLETYGLEEGPTPDQLYLKYGSWEAVLQKAFSTNMGMDACCGLYDEYYRLYIELGYAE